MTPTEVAARARRRRRAALGHRLRHDGPVVRQHHRHAQGRHPRPGLRAVADQDAQRGAAGRSGCCAPPRTTSSRTTPSRASPRSSPSGSPSRSSRARPRRCSAPRRPPASSPSVVGKELKALLTTTKRGGKAQAKADPGQGRRRGPHPHRGPPAQGAAAPQERAGDLLAAGQARRLPQRRRRAQRAVHRRGRLRAGHRQARPQLRVPGAAADPRQDPQRPEGVRLGHAQERRVRRDHPGHRRRLRAHLRPRRGALRQGHPDGRRRRRRRPHPLPAAHPLLPLHAPDGRGGPGLRRGAAAAPHRGGQRRAARRTTYVYTYTEAAAAQDAGRPPAQGQALQGADPALQGPRRDGRRPAGRDHDGPAPPDAAPDHPRRRSRPPSRSSSC